ncbi:MAG: hypothetical protein ACRCZF_25945 [Gemmataceae bacterium]
MRIEVFGLAMEAPGVTAYLWSPWRCTVIETRLFEALTTIPNIEIEKEADEVRLHLNEPKQWKMALTNLSRVLKGWQEEATDAGAERRSWRWLIEGDVDANGYDHKGERSAFWLFARLSVERGGLGDSEKAEELDLNGFGLCVWAIDDE